MNSFDPIAINPVSGTPGVVTFAGVNGTPERAFATDLNNFGPRVGFAYQVSELGPHGAARRRRHFLRPHRQQHDRRHGGAWLLHIGEPGRRAGDDAERIPFCEDGVARVQPPARSTSAYGAVSVGQRPNTSVAYFDPNQVAPTSYQIERERSARVRPRRWRSKSATSATSATTSRRTTSR